MKLQQSFVAAAGTLEEIVDPVAVEKILRLLAKDPGAVPALWRAATAAAATAKLTTFGNGVLFDKEEFNRRWRISGDAEVALDTQNGVILNSIAGKSAHLVLDGIKAPDGVVLHMIARFRANIEHNLYVKFVGASNSTIRFSNTGIALVEGEFLAATQVKLPHLYSLSIDAHAICIYVDGVLKGRKRHAGLETLTAVEIDLVGNKNADLGAELHAIEIWQRLPQNEPTDIALVKLTDRVIASLAPQLAAGDPAAVEEELSRFDDLDLKPHQRTLTDAIDRHIAANHGYAQWAVESILARLGAPARAQWLASPTTRVPKPIVSVDNVTVVLPVNPGRQITFRRLMGRGSPDDFFNAVDGVSFEAYPGDIIGIIGVNGAGKSTLLRALAGLMPIATGEIRLHSQPLLLSPGLGIRNELSGRENIFLALYFMGLNYGQAVKIVDQIIEFSELGKAIERPFKYYSDGMKSRLIFSIATAANPEIIMLDELLNAGDISFQQKAAKRMDQVIKGAHVALVVTHGVGFVLEKCTKALLMANGKPLYFGSPKIAVSRYFEVLHLTAPSMNEIVDQPTLVLPAQGMFIGGSSI